MWRNSKNTSGWPKNLKSRQIVRLGKHLPLTSYSGFPKLPYESLHGAIRFAVSVSIRSRLTNPDIWRRSRLFTCCSIFAVCRIPRIWNLSFTMRARARVRVCVCLICLMFTPTPGGSVQPSTQPTMFLSPSVIHCHRWYITNMIARWTLLRLIFQRTQRYLLNKTIL